MKKFMGILMFNLKSNLNDDLPAKTRGISIE